METVWRLRLPTLTVPLSLVSPATCLRADRCLAWEGHRVAAGGGSDSREGSETCQHRELLHLLQELQQGIFKYVAHAMRGRGSHPTNTPQRVLPAGCRLPAPVSPVLEHIPQKQHPPRNSAAFLQFSHPSPLLISNVLRKLVLFF